MKLKINIAPEAFETHLVTHGTIEARLKNIAKCINATVTSPEVVSMLAHEVNGSKVITDLAGEHLGVIVVTSEFPRPGGSRGRRR